ncbi:anthranilate synthase component II [Staphylococcus canis]|uniref:Aminodeoxychorismate/anthranilate synthase component II n=1 Tax=Staphylococcus canis TaxID=2724942 RepID=A0ABS0T9C8_9STAP|nr:aminodeoxychorismate/anthranilate synthase component II [Staphylococcus canis]MBI5974383.1 aminodeoxychorismate/anthranilate synthase component II [Staphylococcus canis]
MILMIDNYDSFTYNLVDMLREFDEVVIKYPDDLTLFDIEPDAIVISPGPGHPADTEHLMHIINHYQNKPILGVCLGAQALYHYYGGNVRVGSQVMHGKVDKLQLEAPSILYQDISEDSEIMRYHSLICDEATLPKELIVTARTPDCIQSFEHQDKLHFGIQYHPESFASIQVKSVIEQFINAYRKVDAE